ncbi:hypothetical protein CANMA_000030 [Candida margitis]|uniref:uncharacterized protein n=1 Tax=Candida margitis TaxID=1775924 RepID=UPI0022279D80|nr:uncharacterized protein CANMA_000030 [Candida margitis]KAI5970870.1 hypothetical protein CANMA_000030 [Candida margitis]
MSLADGEYELDLSILTDPNYVSHDSENVAIRYGFIPDSMDQSKPVRLYQNDQQCILSALSSESDKPILFEGTSQKHTLNKNMEYYLTCGTNSDNKLKLNQLNSTIRVNKSRSGPKLSTEITKLEEEYKQQIRKRQYEQETKKGQSPSPRKQKAKASDTSVVDASNAKKVMRDSKAAPRSKVASKRPPPEPKQSEPIISESDFEDLVQNDTKPPANVLSSNHTDSKGGSSNQRASNAPKQQVPTAESKENTTLTKRQTHTQIDQANQTVDLDDDFKDLEDQLQELLGEEEHEEEGPKVEDAGLRKEAITLPNAVPKRHNESSESGSDADESDYEHVKFENIQIENNSRPKKSKHFALTSTHQKPVSLRDFMGRSKKSKDDGSSSEEE